MSEKYEDRPQISCTFSTGDPAVIGELLDTAKRMGFTAVVVEGNVADLAHSSAERVNNNTLPGLVSLWSKRAKDGVARKKLSKMTVKHIRRCADELNNVLAVDVENLPASAPPSGVAGKGDTDAN